MSVRAAGQLLIGAGRSASGRVCEVLGIRRDNGPRTCMIRWMDAGSKHLLIRDREDMVLTVKAA